MRNTRLVLKRIIAVVLVIAISITVFCTTNLSMAQAEVKTLRLGQVKNLAFANSTSYKRIKNKIALKEVSYKQAVKALQLKKKNMSTFRWTPLLSFKFPEKADLVDESEYVYKPMQIQNQITELKHQLNDEVFAIYEEVGLLYTEIYGYQTTIEFQEEQLEKLEDTLSKNEYRLMLGMANKTDVESIEKTIKSLEISLASNIKKFELAKEKLSSMINLDVTTGYKFANPYIDSEIPRSELDNLVQYTLDNSQEYYAAKLNTALALLSLDVNYDLMKGQYGGKISYISSYVTQVKNGEIPDGAAFKSSYDEFLKAIDAPWQGKKKILFIKIPKEWFKGAIDGVRYVEDEPYALYEAALEYVDAQNEQKQIKKEIENQVRSDYETLVSARTSYINTSKQVDKEEENLNKMLNLNALGECTFDEYTTAKEEFEDLQMSQLEALELYTTLLYSYDRLTCGGVTKYLDEAGIELDSVGGGNSYVVEEETDTAKYYINSIVEDNMFEFGIYLPDDFETEITHYELWADDYQIGERTSIDKSIRHLMITIDNVEKVYVRVYDSDKFVDECTIDSQVYQGELKIITGYVIEKEETTKDIGTYVVTDNADGVTSQIKMDINPGEGVAYYQLVTSDGKNVFTENFTSAAETFQYLSFISGNLEQITIKCYDSNKEFLYDAYFRSGDYSIYTK